MTELIDTHVHLYDSDFELDIADVVAIAKSSGVSKVVLPAVDSSSYNKMTELSLSLQGFAYPSLGLHPTSVKDNWRDELEFVRSYTFMLKTRFEEKLKIEIDVQPDQDDYIVPMSMQLLIE
ncbi:MAG: TatD family hydrolase, partial [Bacteroidales bacterium]|nr:TatD family hydrolase [Bacteroidales bacterium]